MLTYLEVSDFSFLAQYICATENLNFFDYLTNSNLKIEKYNPTTWQDVDNLSQIENNLFEESDLKPCLIDLGILVIDEQNLGILEKLKPLDTNYYFYTTEDKKLTAETKKLLKKIDVEYLNFKSLDKNVAASLVQKYLDYRKVEIHKLNLNPIIDQSLNYQELVDNLDFIFLAKDKHQEAINSLLKEEQLPIFMYGFRTTNLASDVSRWLQRISSDDLQLHLSLIFTKLDKQKNTTSKLLQQELINTDQRIKNISKIDGQTWLKYFYYTASTF